jgi:hypothetical protein
MFLFFAGRIIHAVNKDCNDIAISCIELLNGSELISI